MLLHVRTVKILFLSVMNFVTKLETVIKGNQHIIMHKIEISPVVIVMRDEKSPHCYNFVKVDKRFVPINKTEKTEHFFNIVLE